MQCVGVCDALEGSVCVPPIGASGLCASSTDFSTMDPDQACLACSGGSNAIHGAWCRFRNCCGRGSVWQDGHAPASGMCVVCDCGGVRVLLIEDSEPVSGLQHRSALGSGNAPHVGGVGVHAFANAPPP